ncbi:hypothetical protein BH20ACI2_BH20ACI2_02690 [soil metagenome]
MDAEMQRVESERSVWELGGLRWGREATQECSDDAINVPTDNGTSFIIPNNLLP